MGDPRGRAGQVVKKDEAGAVRARALRMIADPGRRDRGLERLVLECIIEQLGDRDRQRTQELRHVAATKCAEASREAEQLEQVTRRRRVDVRRRHCIERLQHAGELAVAGDEAAP
jgi:hypothetical protein